MRGVVLAVAVAVAGCVAIPMPDNEPADPGNDDAVALAVDVWSDVLDTELGDPPPFLWFEGQCLDYRDGDTGCTSGRAFLWWYYDHREFHGIWGNRQQVIAHELLHWALDARYGDVDKDHRRREWDDVAGIRELLVEAGY